jgi:hypothetical protein
MVKWDLKTRTCFFYDTRSSGFMAVYTGQGTTGENEVKLIKLVESCSKKYLVLPGSTTATSIPNLSE